MTKNTERVFHGWIELSESEKREFDQAVRDYREANYSEKTATKRRLDETVVKMELGPLSGACPCCGR